MRLHLKSFIWIALLAAGCGSAETATTVADSQAGAKESLLCDHDAKAAGDAASTDVNPVATLPRNKDEAQDIMGVPGGAWFSGEATAGAAANSYAALDAADTAKLPDAVKLPSYARYFLSGRKARSKLDQGLTATPLAQQSLIAHTSLLPSHTEMGTTGADGSYHDLVALLPGQTAGLHAAFVDLAAAPELDCTEHYLLLRAAGTPFVVTDIDGTLTTSDAEFMHQLTDLSYDPKEMAGACAMMQVWAAKGYPIVYMTARPHIGRAESRAWLQAHQCPPGPMLTAEQLVMDDNARKYKAMWMNRLIKDLGWTVAAAYGNATSDIHAYADAGIPTSKTFIVGVHGGEEGTTAVAGNDFTAHTAGFVQAQGKAPAP